MRDEDSLRPLLAVGGAILLLSLMDALVKFVAADHATWQIVLLRYAVGACVALPIFLARERSFPGRTTIRNSALRGIAAMATAYCFFYALSVIPLVKAVALSFSAPLFMIIIARILLGEPITLRALAAIALGSAGVIVMLWQPLMASSAPSDLSGEFAVLAAALFYAVSVVLTRLHGQSDNAHTMVFTQSICIVVYALPFGAYYWAPVNGVNLLIFAIVGTLGTLATILMAWGFSRASASRLGPIEYTNLIWTSVLGFVVFSEVPSAFTVVGGGLIVAASVIAARRRRQLPATASQELT